MNIVLADVQSLNVNLADPGAQTEMSTENLSGGEFSNLLEKQLAQDIESPMPVEYSQVVDLKGLNLNSEMLAELEGSALSDAEIPGAWLDYLASERLSITTDAAQPKQVNGLTQAGQLADTEVAGLQPGIPIGIIGEVLPGGGNSLPPVVTTANPTPAVAVSASVSNGQPEVLTPVKPVLTQLTGQINIKVDADAGTTDLQSDLKNSEWSTVLRQSEAGPGLKPGLTSKNAEFQSVQSTIAEIADAGNNQHRLQTPGLGLQATTATQITSLLPTSLETLTVSNSRDTAAWGSGVGERVKLMINQKLNTATIRLDPPMLGRLDIQIQITDDVTNVTINTQHAQTRDIIDNASFRLREYLQENGYQNVNVDVSHQQQQDQASQQLDDDATGFVSDNTNAQDLTDSDVSQTVQYFGSDSVVDYFA